MLDLLNEGMESPFGVVDMGSNGIRFGIVTSLSRHLPVNFEERAPISLLEASGDDKVIPEETINQVITSFLRFKTICRLENVDEKNIKVFATEATRIAVNSEPFLSSIYKATGWKVRTLEKEEEAIISSMGIVGTFYDVNGLTMDLGGGSVELSYVTSKNKQKDRPKKRIKTSKSPVSLPYGAAILKKKLQTCTNEKMKTKLFETLVEKIKEAKVTADSPKDLETNDGYTLYLSGGGFRAFGYLSMALSDFSDEKMNYPIPIISGYSISGEDILKLAEKFIDEDPEELVTKIKVFRISKRRTRMIPAICFLMSAIAKAIKINRVFFSEGGARQGMCYYMLSSAEKSKDPLLEGIKAYIETTPQAIKQDEYDIIYRTLKNSTPSLYLERNHPLQLHRLIPAAIYLANLTTHYPKETKAFAAFNIPLAGGPLSDVPGLLHSDRAVLSLILAYRQGGKVPDPTFNAIENLVGENGVSVCKYVGRLMEIIFLLSPGQPGTALLESGIQFKLDTLEQQDHLFTSQYRPSKLQIIMPKKCPLLEAPSVLSIIENMDKKIQKKKNKTYPELTDSESSKPRLFSVEIISNLAR